MKQFLTACILFLVATTASHALVMGDLQVDSYLDAPLKAQIKVTQVNSDQGFSAMITNPNLAKIIQLTSRADGQSVLITLTSSQAISEPLLNLPIAVSTAGAAAVKRDYMLLLSPRTMPDSVAPNVLSSNFVSKNQLIDTRLDKLESTLRQLQIVQHDRAKRMAASQTASRALQEKIQQQAFSLAQLEAKLLVLDKGLVAQSKDQTAHLKKQDAAIAVLKHNVKTLQAAAKAEGEFSYGLLIALVLVILIAIMVVLRLKGFSLRRLSIKLPSHNKKDNQNADSIPEDSDLASEVMVVKPQAASQTKGDVIVASSTREQTASATSAPESEPELKSEQEPTPKVIDQPEQEAKQDTPPADSGLRLAPQDDNAIHSKSSDKNRPPKE